MSSVLVIGSRDAEGFINAVDELGRVAADSFAEGDLAFSCASYGELARTLGQYVRLCTCNVVGEVRRVSRLPTGTVRIQSWPTFGTRLDYLMEADGFLFFPGHEGTWIHAAHAIHHNRRYNDGRPKPLALVGWSRDRSSELIDGIGMNADEIAHWFRVFPFEGVAEAFRFVTTAV